MNNVQIEKRLPVTVFLWRRLRGMKEEFDETV